MIFGNLFDINRDGKVDLGETALELAMIAEEVETIEKYERSRPQRKKLSLTDEDFSVVETDGEEFNR